MGYPFTVSGRYLMSALALHCGPALLASAPAGSSSRLCLDLATGRCWRLEEVEAQVPLPPGGLLAVAPLGGLDLDPDPRALGPPPPPLGPSAWE